MGYESTSGIAAAKSRAVSRPKKFPEQIAFLAAEGTRARIEAARGVMSQADFLRWAIGFAVAEKLERERK